MHVISRKRLKEACDKHPDLESPLDTWYRAAKKARWVKLTDTQATWPSAEAVGRFTVFNVKGNKCRLITEINYRTGRVFIRHVLTHAEYDRGRWKE